MSEYFDDSLYETSEHRQTAPEQMPQMTGREKHKKSGAGKAVALVLVCALVSGCMGVGGAFLGSRLVRQGQPETVLSDGVSTVMKGVRETSVLQIQQIDSSKTLSAAEVYAANVNSTVGIVTSAVTTNFWGQRTTSAAAGSGFLLLHALYPALRILRYPGAEYGYSAGGKRGHRPHQGSRPGYRI